MVFSFLNFCIFKRFFWRKSFFLPPFWIINFSSKINLSRTFATGYEGHEFTPYVRIKNRHWNFISCENFSLFQGRSLKSPLSADVMQLRQNTAKKQSVQAEIVFCLNDCTANDQEKSVKCNLIFLQGAEVEKRTASKSFLKARPKAEPSECLQAGLFSTEAPWGKIKLHEEIFLRRVWAEL